MQDEALAQRFAALPELLAADAWLARRGRFLVADALVGVGSVPFHLALANGRVTLARGTGLMRSWQFAVRGTARAWAEHWRPVPAPGWHDLLALQKQGELTLEGDMHPLLANLQFLKDLLALPRGAA